MGNTSMDGQAASSAPSSSLRALGLQRGSSQLAGSSWWQSSSGDSDWEEDTSSSSHSLGSIRVESLE